MHRMEIKALKKARVAKSLTLEEIGRHLGVNKSTVMRWENGIIPVPLKHIEKLERFTGVHRSSLRPDVYSEAAA